MNPLISVIVPVYNAEKFIDRCIESVVNQTYTNLEIILVNDGSSDNSGVICDIWEKKDGRIRAFHKENGGAGETRNFGVEKATGEYIAFIDSDDIIAPFYLSFLYNNLIDNNADISCCMFSALKDNEALSCNDNKYDESNHIMTGYDVCKKMILDCDVFLISPWCKLIKSEIVQKCSFPTGCICEDEATSCRFYYYADRVVLSEAKLYGYFYNECSVMNSHSSKRVSDCIYVLNYRTDFFVNCNEHELTCLCINSLLHFLIFEAKPNKRFNKNICNFLIKYWFNKDFCLNARKELLYYLLFGNN